MNENQNNVQYYEDEIDLRELIMALWKRKKMIISLTLVVAILAGMFSMFVLSPVYETKLNIVISMPEKYDTRYGEYTLPITTNQEYVNLIKSNNVIINTIDKMGYSSEEASLDSLKKRITVTQNDAKTGSVNSFEVTVSADNPEESLKLAQILYSNYLDFIDVMTKERAVDYYYNSFNVEMKSLENSLERVKELLKSNEELLAQTPRLIGEGQANLEIQTQLNNDSNYVVPVDTVNPNYIKIENDIISNKQSINSIEASMNQYSRYMEELDVERAAIKKYYRTGEAETLESSVVGLVETYVYLPSPPVAPTQKTSPRNSLNVAIGIVLGGMLGVMVALFQEYWFKEDKK
ncbi:MULTISPECIES: Wzz/FepE/Etk N-terminal domain-containing protein [unclassified Sedimentibacter]|uniref:Wzz/FepE/Etk N-terminal domain-containing protein n=1 Tax=unclassified Sedimentibacter TaxID=2649220 RepID=UPI0027DF2A1E|nr:Wzz/FepE/Etk N-terminal domain-containing protein [Sedimentibacter sp. MB35-C1]WMJ78088.1 Wzz/FepE/Etk N-terminal domain-containing protein [Sedimentibacter sp. MB35-C1]